VAKIREVRRFSLAVKKQPSKLLLEKLDGARQGGLRHIAPLGCAREIQLLGHREEITNLVHSHDDLTGMVDGHGSIGRTLLPKTLLSTFAVPLVALGIAEPSAEAGRDSRAVKFLHICLLKS
jgi:hypothetical protein